MPKPIQATELLLEAIAKLTPTSLVAKPAPPENSKADKIFDRDAAMAQVDGDSELFSEITDLFFSNGSGQKSEIKEAI